MTDFRIGIMPSLGFANKTHSELPRGSVEADTFPFHPRLGALFFRDRGHLLFITSQVISIPYDGAGDARSRAMGRKVSDQVS